MAEGAGAPQDSNGSQDVTRITEIDVLWITAGLGCDGDTIAMTAATQPSLEDIILGGLPWLPKVNFRNPVLTYENGNDFLKHFHHAAEGKLAPFILVIEGSIPDETNKPEGYWSGFGTDAVTGQPITVCEWIDRLAPKAWAVLAAGTCATYGGIHAMQGNPTGCMGLPDYLGWNWKSWMGGIGGCPNVGGICIGCTMPGFPDKFMPFMDQPPGSLLSAHAVKTYGRAIHALLRFTLGSLNKEPSWRARPRLS